MKKNRIMRTLLLSTVLVTVILGLFLTTANGKGKSKMEIIYDANGNMMLTPQIYTVDKSISLSLFPVPKDNAVGTNSYREAISIFSFPKGKLDIDNYFKGAVSSLSISGTYLPVISPDLIGFGQIRRFVLFDFKNKTHEQYAIAFSIDETIEKIAIADASKRRFIFEIKGYNRHSQDAYDFSKTLKLIDLSERGVNVIKKLPKKAGSTWSMAHGKVFLWYFDDKKMQVYDMNLEPSQHPLGELIKKNKNGDDFIAMYPHPFLPFVILGSGYKTSAKLISWGEGRDKKIQFIPEGDYFSFSPDGRWIIYKKDVSSNDQRTYLMPVSEKYPNYLGTPILLIKDYFEPYNCAWTTNPISFVGSSLNKLYRWELSNEAYPESDKPTFHEYIVEKDLERMAKEKKQ